MEGSNSGRFLASLRKKLKPGRHQVIAIATNSAGQRSERTRAKFRVLG